MEANVLAEHALFLNENTGQDQIHHKRPHNVIDQPPNSSATQICAGVFSYVFLLRM